ncbi:MAG: phosphoglucomutase/phosphomannomutase family protein, partial [Atopobiaceae bacterium]|nr:phosphoglucomutase/phosphomannomutase family protein [Atopobiaceae bacterium]MDD3177782.1 phosphoglucomutase/phosphomannomutase family protein [Atopobiaceae bacterium]MDD4380738.1 phosphoglucomutase/phosphomannomutase family protein [Atopobiaceae bacterium]
MQVIHFVADGWYARYDDGFEVGNVSRVVDAAASLWSASMPGAAVYVGYDTRDGSDEFARAAAVVLSAHGLDVHLSDSACPTPALARAINTDQGACGGVMVTASQRPAGMGGLRIRCADGSAVDALDLETMEALVPPDAPDITGEVGTVDLMGPYLRTLHGLADHEALAGSSLSVVVDPMYGAARGHLAHLLEEEGLDVHEMHGDAVGDFGGLHPEVFEPWVDDCEREVVEKGADLGIVCEGAGDRIGIVDERGNLVPAHKVVALIMDHLVEGRGLSGRIIVPQSASALVKRQAERLGCEVVVCAAGFCWVHDEIVRGGVLLGCDELCGMCVPALAPTRDGLMEALLVCELMGTTHLTLTELVDDLEARLGHMDYGRRDVRLGSAEIQTLRNVLPGANPASVAGQVPVHVNHMDGIRLEMEDGSWLLVRPSRTEPFVRVTAE